MIPDILPLAALTDSQRWIEIAVIAVYLGFLVTIGLLMKGMNANVSDYFRSGAKGTWWLVGMSIFISSVSAFTFTGNAGLVYEAGWTGLVIYWTQGLGLLIAAIFLAAWFRQMRCITHLDIIRQRFGKSTEQILAYLDMSTFAFHGALALYGLALFSSATFGLPLQPTIIILGLVAVFYSTVGGIWAVMATDFVQSLLVIPVTIVLAVFCLIAVGGVGEFFTRVNAIEEYQFLTSDGRFPATWVYAIFMLTLLGQTNISNSVKYFSVKDGKAARKAAAMACLLITTVSIFWFIPSMTARLLFSEQVMASPGSNPAETAFAVSALRLLPTGMIGLMMVAMFSATMSSLDTALNRNAAIVIRNIIPGLRERLGKAPIEDKPALLLSRVMTCVMGVIVVAFALFYSVQEDFAMTKFYYLVGSIVGLPVIVPFFFGLFIKRVPPWAALAAIAGGAIPSVTSFVSAQFFDAPWEFHIRAFTVFSCGLIVFLGTIPFYKNSPEEYKSRIDEFFKRVRTPVDFEKEVGIANDELQLRMLGNATLALSAFVMLLVAAPNPWEGRVAIIAVSLFVGSIGAIMRYTAWKRQRAFGVPETQESASLRGKHPIC